MDIQKLNTAARVYFNTLTPGMKEAIQQTGVEMCTVSDLERFVQNTLKDAPKPHAEEK